MLPNDVENLLCSGLSLLQVPAIQLPRTLDPYIHVNGKVLFPRSSYHRQLAVRTAT